MKANVIKLDAKSAGSIDLDDSVFGLEPRADILHRVVRYQLAKSQAGTHKVKTRSETSYSTKKIYNQKGTGGARHGDRNAPIFRGGGVYKGPKVRSHAHDLTKKFRKLGLKHALSAKATAGELIVIDSVEAKTSQTADLAKVVTNLAVVTACLGASLYTDVENSNFSVTAAIAGMIENGSRKGTPSKNSLLPSSLYGYVESHSFG